MNFPKSSFAGLVLDQSKVKVISEPPLISILLGVEAGGTSQENLSSTKQRERKKARVPYSFNTYSVFLTVAVCGKSEMQVEKWETPTLQHVKEFHEAQPPLIPLA